MFRKHFLLRGAVILTAAGLLSRIMGFFFRIFLSHAFGEENVGLYQLVFPVYALCLSVSTSGLQTALSRITAAKISLGKENEARHALYIALSLTLILSFIQIILVQQNANYIASVYLGDNRCAEMLVIISYALPCAAIHGCICGYSLGMQHTGLAAVSQLIEQITRILFVILLFIFFRQSGRIPSVRLAAVGIVAGELASALFSANRLKLINSHLFSKSDDSQKKHFKKMKYLISHVTGTTKHLLTLSLPLTANRVTVTLLQSIEAASIPASLKLYGLNTSDALSLYGVLTGMALPCILFPSAITGSVGTVLMPAISSAQACGSDSSIISLLKKTIMSCLILGFSSCLFFLIFGNMIGLILFHSNSAGRFIITLAWICPFLYTNTCLLSALNGLGKTTFNFLINTAGLLVRIAGVFFAIPSSGITGYLRTLLLSQITVSILSGTALFIIIRKEMLSPKPD